MNSVPAVQPGRKSAPFQARAKLESLSAPLQGGIRILHHPIPASPSAHLTAAYLPLAGENRAYHVPQSILERVGAAFSPAEHQLCTVIGEHRILSTCPFGPSLSASFGLPSFTRFISSSVPFSMLSLASPRPHDACSIGIPSRVFLIGLHCLPGFAPRRYQRRTPG